jgi:hypothetical protein
MNEIPQDELFSAYLDDELTPEQRAQVKQILRDNEEARQTLDALRSLRARLSALPRYHLEEGFAQRVLQRAERQMVLGSATDLPAEPSETDHAAEGTEAVSPEAMSPEAMSAETASVASGSSETTDALPRDVARQSADSQSRNRPSDRPRRDDRAMPSRKSDARDSLWRRSTRSLVWTTLAVAAALAIMMFQPRREEIVQNEPPLVDRASPESQGLGTGVTAGRLAERNAPLDAFAEDDKPHDMATEPAARPRDSAPVNSETADRDHTPRFSTVPERARMIDPSDPASVATDGQRQRSATGDSAAYAAPAQASEDPRLLIVEVDLPADRSGEAVFTRLAVRNQLMSKQAALGLLRQEVIDPRRESTAGGEGLAVENSSQAGAARAATLEGDSASPTTAPSTDTPPADEALVENERPAGNRAAGSANGVITEPYYYVEATPSQIQAMLRDLSRAEETLEMAVDPAPGDAQQQALTEWFFQNAEKPAGSGQAAAGAALAPAGEPSDAPVLKRGTPAEVAPEDLAESESTAPSTGEDSQSKQPRKEWFGQDRPRDENGMAQRGSNRRTAVMRRAELENLVREHRLRIEQQERFEQPARQAAPLSRALLPDSASNGKIVDSNPGDADAVPVARNRVDRLRPLAERHSLDGEDRSRQMGRMAEPQPGATARGAIKRDDADKDAPADDTRGENAARDKNNSHGNNKTGENSDANNSEKRSGASADGVEGEEGPVPPASLKTAPAQSDALSGETKSDRIRAPRESRPKPATPGHVGADPAPAIVDSAIPLAGRQARTEPVVRVLFMFRRVAATESQAVESQPADARQPSTQKADIEPPNTAQPNSAQPNSAQPNSAQPNTEQPDSENSDAENSDSALPDSA